MLRGRRVSGPRRDGGVLAPAACPRDRGQLRDRRIDSLTRRNLAGISEGMTEFPCGRFSGSPRRARSARRRASRLRRLPDRPLGNSIGARARPNLPELSAHRSPVADQRTILRGREAFRVVLACHASWPRPSATRLGASLVPPVKLSAPSKSSRKTRDGNQADDCLKRVRRLAQLCGQIPFN
jgi:hypothetical protein